MISDGCIPNGCPVWISIMRPCFVFIKFFIQFEIPRNGYHRRVLIARGMISSITNAPLFFFSKEFFHWRNRMEGRRPSCLFVESKRQTWKFWDIVIHFLGLLLLLIVWEYFITNCFWWSSVKNLGIPVISVNALKLSLVNHLILPKILEKLLH